MKGFIAIVIAEVGWIMFAASGPIWAFFVGFVGFALTPALVIEYRERAREIHLGLEPALHLLHQEAKEVMP